MILQVTALAQGAGNVWEDLMRDVNAVPEIQAAFYAAAAWLISFPMGELAHLIAKVPTQRITAQNTPYALAFISWVVCWFAARYVPGIDRGMLTLAVTGGALLGTKTREDVTAPLAKAIKSQTDIE